MFNLLLATGRQHLFSRFVRRLTTAHSYGRKAGQYKDFDHASLQKASFFLQNYVQRLPYQDSKCTPSDEKILLVSDVKELQTCQSCVKTYKSILSEDKLSATQENILNAIQMKIWNFHIIDLDFEQLFELIERSIMKKYPCEHLSRALFVRATEKFDEYDWDTTSITRLMLTTIVYRDVPRTLLHKVHSFVCLNLNLFSLNELTVIVNAFYIGKFNYDDSDFLTSAVFYKALKNLDSMGTGQLSLLIKACHFHRINNFSALSDIAKELMKDEEVLKKHCSNFIDVSQLMRQYAKAKLDIPEFVMAALRVMPKPEIANMQQRDDAGIFNLGKHKARYIVRLKDIGSLSWALGSMAYDLDNKTGIHSYLEEVFTAIYTPGSRIDHRTLKDFFFGQVVAGRFTPVFFNYMRDTVTHQLSDELKSKYTEEPRGWLTLLLRVAMDIECPEVELQKLPRGLLERKMKSNATLYEQQELKRVTKRMNELLGDRLLVIHTILPYIPSVAEIRLDENNRPVSFKPTRYEDLLEDMKNKKLLLRRGRRIVLVLANKGNYMLSAKNTSTMAMDRPSGVTLLARRHLQKLGYESCVINTHSVSLEEKPIYILKHLEKEFGLVLNKEILQRYRTRYRTEPNLRTNTKKKGLRPA